VAHGRLVRFPGWRIIPLSLLTMRKGCSVTPNVGVQPRPKAVGWNNGLERTKPTIMEVPLLLLSLVALLAFFIWDRRRLQSGAVKPLSREALAKGWSARPLLVWPIHAALSLCMAVLAIVEYRAPSLPPFRGKWSFVKEFAFSTFGTFGLAYVWSAVSLLLLLLALAAWRSRALAKGSTSPPNAL
jgi:hypothetical protein